MENIIKISSNGLPIVEISGKIQTIEKIVNQDGEFKGFATVVISPAKDEYSHPKRWRIQSDTSIGKVDQTIIQNCELDNYWNKGFCNYSLRVL